LREKEEERQRLALEMEEREQEFRRRLTEKNDTINKLSGSVSELNK